MSPEELIDFVKDRKSFLAFVEALSRDKETSNKMEKENPSSPYGASALGWENATIEDFLESAATWANDSGEKFSNEASWKNFAEFLLAGKYYE